MVSCDPEDEAGSHSCCQSNGNSRPRRFYMFPTQNFEGFVCSPPQRFCTWGATLSKTHDMTKKPRAAREQPDKQFAILAEPTSTRGCQELANPRLCQNLLDCLRVTMESTGRHGQDSLVESIHFPWFFHVQHQDTMLHAWLLQAPQCATRALQPHWPPHWRSRVCAQSRVQSITEDAVEYRWPKVPHLIHGHSCHKKNFARVCTLSACTKLLSTLPVASRFWRTSLRAATSVLATVLTPPSSVRPMAINLFRIYRVHLLETFDCVNFQRSCHVSNLERVNFLQEQVAATLLNPRNMPDLNCIPPDQHDQG